MPRLRLLSVCAAIPLVAVGCRSDGRVAKTNDTLRLERETQTGRINSLEAELAETRAKLAEANARLDSPVPDDVLGALPRVAQVSIGRLSLVETDRVVVFVSPTDGRGRFVQAVGTLEVRAIEVGAEPRVLGEALLSPAQLRDAYVSGLAGTAYRVELPISDPPTAAVTLTAALHDHLTGLTHDAERILASAAASPE